MMKILALILVIKKNKNMNKLYKNKDRSEISQQGLKHFFQSSGK